MLEKRTKIMYTVFIDETGKTGSQRYDGKWNFDAQPYFLLSGIIVPNESIVDLQQEIKVICKKHKIQGELKAGKASKNKNELIAEFDSLQKKYHFDFIMSAEQKRFSIIKTIVDYCILPYYDMSFIQSLEEKLMLTRSKKLFANYVYGKVTDELLGEIVEFFDGDTKDRTRLIELCQTIKTQCNHELISGSIDETIDCLERYEELGLGKHNLFPLIDKYKGDSTVAVIPHIDTLNNLIQRIQSSNIDKFKLVHDRINDLEDTFILNCKDRWGVLDDDFITFSDSKSNSIIQFADFWGGTIRNYIQSVLQGKHEENEILNKIVQQKLNFVSTLEEQETLFSQNDDLKLLYNNYKEIFG